MNESGGAQPGVNRLTRRLYKLKGAPSLQPLLSVLKDVVAEGRDGAMSTRRREALDQIARLFRIS